MDGERVLLWQRLDLPGTEVLRLRMSATEVVASAVILSVFEGEPFELRYELVCDGSWRLRRALLLVTQAGAKRTLELLTDGAGAWLRGDGRAIAELEGCLDIDISVTPYTNTLPIRRLNLALGQRHEISVAYVDVPTLEVSPAHQWYTRLADVGEVAYYLFQSESGFHAVLRVNGDGLVVDYPGLFARYRP